MITAFRVSKLIGSLCVLQLLSKSIEQLRQPSAHLQESEEELEDQQQHRDEMESMQEDALPPGGVIRKHTLSSSSGSSGEMPDAPCGVIKVKEEPIDSEDEALTNQRLESEQSTYLHQVKGRLVIRAMIWSRDEHEIVHFQRSQTCTTTHVHTKQALHSRPALSVETC